MNHHKDARDDHDGDHALCRLTVKNSPVGMCLVGLDGSLWLPTARVRRDGRRSVEAIRDLTLQKLTTPM